MMNQHGHRVFGYRRPESTHQVYIDIVVKLHIHVPGVHQFTVVRNLAVALSPGQRIPQIRYLPGS